MLERYVKLEECISDISTDFGAKFQRLLLTEDESKSVRDIIRCLQPFQVCDKRLGSVLFLSILYYSPRGGVIPVE
jgi:hypothetical protein